VHAAAKPASVKSVIPKYEGKPAVMAPRVRLRQTALLAAEASLPPWKIWSAPLKAVKKASEAKRFIPSKSISKGSCRIAKKGICAKASAK